MRSYCKQQVGAGGPVVPMLRIKVRAVQCARRIGGEVTRSTGDPVGCFYRLQLVQGFCYLAPAACTPHPTLDRTPMIARTLRSLTALAAALLLAPVQALTINRLIVHIHTRDVTFASTDDPTHLIIGGKDFNLDNPDHDDLERNNNDEFILRPNDAGFTLELVKLIGTIVVEKTEDSYFGGGWAFGGITIWAESTGSTPIYRNDAVNVWLDGDGLEWSTTFGDPGWNIPDEPPFPPCVTGDVDLGLVIDSDCDGTPDNDDPKFDTPVDSDGDGLPDPYETGQGLDPNNPDQDSDGWIDGKKNRRSVLILERIECLDEEEDIGRDELYVAVEDVRYPLSAALDAAWPLDEGDHVSPFTIVDSRVSGPTGALAFTSRLRIREADPYYFKKPTDDTYSIQDLSWGESGSFQVDFAGDDMHYILSFRAATATFADAQPREDSDTDGDGLSDGLEFRLSTQDPTVQQTPQPGFNGLADPGRRNLFLTFDMSGSGYGIAYNTKQMVVSQYAVHDIAFRFDDGYLGDGGDILPYDASVTTSDAEAFGDGPDGQFAGRKRIYRYCVSAEEACCEGHSGVANFPSSGKRNVVLARQTEWAGWSPIVLMHELGHSVGLCHRDGDGVGQESADCTVPEASRPIQCPGYCGVDQDSNTAMGANLGGLLGIIVIGAIGLGLGIWAGIKIGAAIGSTLGGVIGGIIGGIIGGLIGGIAGFMGSDAYLRLVDYAPQEWDGLVFFLNTVFP